jgi:hypothetical protein
MQLDASHGITLGTFYAPRSEFLKILDENRY